MKITKELLAKTLHESLYGEGGEFSKDSLWQDPNNGFSYMLSGSYESAPEKYRKHMEIAAQRAIDLMEEEEPLTDEQHMEYIRKNWSDTIFPAILSRTFLPNAKYMILNGLSAIDFEYGYLVVHIKTLKCFAVYNHGPSVVNVFPVYPFAELKFTAINDSDSQQAQAILRNIISR